MTEGTPPLVDYPTHYCFKAMGPAGIGKRVRELVEEVLGALGDEAFVERPSTKGKYVSISAHVYLKNEEERKRIYEAFHREKSIVWYV